MLRHRSHRLAAAQELAGQIDRDDGAPILESHIDEIRVALYAGIGDEDVEPAEMLDRGAEHRDDLIFVRDIGLERERVGTGLPNLRNNGIGGLGMSDVIDADIRAGRTQRQGDAAADAGIRTRDERLLPLQQTPRDARIIVLRHRFPSCCGNLLR